jgi:hypothetical protein
MAYLPGAPRKDGPAALPYQHNRFRGKGQGAALSVDLRRRSGGQDGPADRPYLLDQGRREPKAGGGVAYVLLNTYGAIGQGFFTIMVV